MMQLFIPPELTVTQRTCSTNPVAVPAHPSCPQELSAAAATDRGRADWGQAPCQPWPAWPPGQGVWRGALPSRSVSCLSDFLARTPMLTQLRICPSPLSVALVENSVPLVERSPAQLGHRLVAGTDCSHCPRACACLLQLDHIRETSTFSGPRSPTIANPLILLRYLIVWP